MFILTIKNHKDEILTLTQNSAYTITNISGLNPPTANINTVESALLDGSTFNSSKMGNRNIVIDVVIEGNAEANRINLYKYVKVKKPCTLYFKNGRRDVYIEGYVESLECDLFENKQIAQISIICPKPYFIDIETTTIGFSNTVALFDFPFSISSEGEKMSRVASSDYIAINNEGDIETGAIVEIKAANGTMSNPVITNTTTGEYFKVNYNFEQADTLRINTNIGRKSVTLIRSGTEINLINYRDKGSKWLQFDVGTNAVTCDANSGSENMTCTISYNAKYEGV